MSKQNYAVFCYTCEHNGKETCKGCNTILNGENEPYENWQLREDLCQKDEQIADLQHRLEVAEKALELACDYLVSVEGDELHELCKDIYNDNDYLMAKMNYFKAQAEKELKGELWKNLNILKMNLQNF